MPPSGRTGRRGLFPIDHDSHLPLYVQIGRAVRQEIAEGRLRPGDPLPSIRAVAESLQISPNTVIQAYRELVSAGVAVVRRGRGTFVADPEGFRPGQRRRLGEALVREMVERASRLGLTPGELRALLERQLAGNGGSREPAPP